MIRVLDGTSTRLDQLRPVRSLQPEPARVRHAPRALRLRPRGLPAEHLDRLRARRTGLPAAVAGPLREFLRRPNYTRFEVLAMRIIEHISPKRELPSLTDHIPGGIFDNKSLERWLRRSLQRIKMPNDFRAFARKTGKRLYVTAC
jgi:hypothetical protein